jgi:hypothetical protein
MAHDCDPLTAQLSQEAGQLLRLDAWTQFLGNLKSRSLGRELTQHCLGRLSGTEQGAGHDHLEPDAPGVKCHSDRLGLRLAKLGQGAVRIVGYAALAHRVGVCMSNYEEVHGRVLSGAVANSS